MKEFEMKVVPDMKELIASNPMAKANETALIEITRKIEEFKMMGLFAPHYDLASPFGGRSSLQRLHAKTSR